MCCSPPWRSHVERHAGERSSISRPSCPAGDGTVPYCRSTAFPLHRDMEDHREPFDRAEAAIVLEEGPNGRTEAVIFSGRRATPRPGPGHSRGRPRRSQGAGPPPRRALPNRYPPQKRGRAAGGEGGGTGGGFLPPAGSGASRPPRGDRRGKHPPSASPTTPLLPAVRRLRGKPPHPEQPRLFLRTPSSGR